MKKLVKILFLLCITLSLPTGDNIRINDNDGDCFYEVYHKGTSIFDVQYHPDAFSNPLNIQTCEAYLWTARKAYNEWAVKNGRIEENEYKGIFAE